MNIIPSHSALHAYRLKPTFETVTLNNVRINPLASPFTFLGSVVLPQVTRFGMAMFYNVVTLDPIRADPFNIFPVHVQSCIKSVLGAI